ncbi:MAG: thioesterase family protein [Bacteroidota bacterium]|nr:thioesterase family protein [Bacteroidota bacterium]
MQTSPALFRHRIARRVLSYHVDRQNVVHNLWYFYYFEEARVEYVREIGLPMDSQTFISHHKFFVVRNTCDYLAPAFFDEQLQVLTRITYVRNSSIGFEHLAVRSDGTPVARGEHVFVHVDEATDTPCRVPEALREMIRAYEGDRVRFPAEGEQ